MLCERCQKNQATVHMTKIVNGKKVEMSLCSDCMKEIGIDNPISFQDIFQGLLNITSPVQPNKTATEVVSFQNAQCPVCGLTYDGLRKNGKFGCASCYSTFQPQLDATLKSIHGTMLHKGKIPHKNGEKLLAKRELNQLKKQLALSIEEERYEDAAMFRDKIRALEKGGNKDV